MYLALLYELVDDYLDRRSAFRAEHLALAQAAHERGDLLLAGALAEPANASIFVWRDIDRRVVEEFAHADPYVINGLVTGWSIRPWNVAVGEIAPRQS